MCSVAKPIIKQIRDSREALDRLTAVMSAAISEKN